MNRIIRAKGVKSDRGFTLIEILVAMVVIGVVLAVGSPFFRQWLANIDLRTASRELHSDLQLAKVEAARQNEEIVVNVNVAACGAAPTGYIIFVDDGNGAGGIAGNRQRDGNERIVKNVVLPAGDGPCINQMTAFVPGVQPPGFNPRGLPLDRNNVGLPIAAVTGTIQVASTKTPDVFTTTINVAGNITTQ